MIALDTLPNRRVEDWKWTDLRSAVTQHMLGEPAPSGASRGLIDNGAGEDSVIAQLAMLRAGSPTRFAPVDATSTSDDFGARRWSVAPGEHRLVETLVAPAGLHLNHWRIEIPAGAHVEHVITVSGAADAVPLVRADVHLAEGARYAQTALTTGAKLARLETHVDVRGPGAEVSLNGVSLLAGGRHADHTTVVTHGDVSSVTNEVFRTVASDDARGVFQGKIKVERLAQKTDAKMNHAGLILSGNAMINAKPELEIYADDVQCAHGATVGALDEDGLFYMRQRGLSERRAKALMTRAFIAEALSGVSDETVRAAMDAHVDDWLEAHL